MVAWYNLPNYMEYSLRNKNLLFVMMEQFYTIILPLRVGQAGFGIFFCFSCYKISESDSEK